MDTTSCGEKEALAHRLICRILLLQLSRLRVRDCKTLITSPQKLLNPHQIISLNC